MPESVPEQLTRRLADGLLGRSLMLVTAESCTGGGLAFRLTELPGSSQWFERGFVTYSNAAKEENLGVPATLLAQAGAVSEAVAAAMAEGALAHSRADISVAITGIAGPEGGTPNKPVGLVCFAWAGRGRDTRTAHEVYTGDRASVRNQAIVRGVRGLIDMLESY